MRMAFQQQRILILCTISITTFSGTQFRRRSDGRPHHVHHLGHNDVDTALSADSVDGMAARRLARHAAVFRIDGRSHRSLGHALRHVQGKRSHGRTAARLPTPLASDVHPRTRRTRHHTRFALCHPSNRHGWRLGRTRTGKSRGWSLRNGLGPCRDDRLRWPCFRAPPSAADGSRL